VTGGHRLFSADAYCFRRSLLVEIHCQFAGNGKLAGGAVLGDER